MRRRGAIRRHPATPLQGVEGQGAQRRSKGPMSAARRERKPRSPSEATVEGAPEGMSAPPTTKARFHVAKRNENAAWCHPPLCPFPFSLSSEASA